MPVGVRGRVWARLQLEVEPRGEAPSPVREVEAGTATTGGSAVEPLLGAPAGESPRPDGRGTVVDRPHREDRPATTLSAPARPAPHPALAAQQAFAQDCHRLLRRAEASGHRLVTALYLVLARHAGVPCVTVDGAQHLRCVECRGDGRGPHAQYPCPTAQEAFWALDAALH